MTFCKTDHRLLERDPLLEIGPAIVCPDNAPRALVTDRRSGRELHVRPVNGLLAHDRLGHDRPLHDRLDTDPDRGRPGHAPQVIGLPDNVRQGIGPRVTDPRVQGTSLGTALVTGDAIRTGAGTMPVEMRGPGQRQEL